MPEMDGRGEGTSEGLWWGWVGLCFSHDTKALLCNQLCVKLVLCAGHNGAQRQGAGGPVGSARTQLWTEPAQPRSIWALITSVEVRPRLPQVRRTMRALSKSFVVTFKALFSQNLKYFIRPPFARSHSSGLLWRGELRFTLKSIPLRVNKRLQICLSSDAVLLLLKHANV